MDRENANGGEAQIDRNLAMEAVRVTEAAAIAANRLMGGGDEKAADQAAFKAMFKALQNIDMAGTVSIGENEGNGGTKLLPGDSVGTGEGVNVEVAMVPLEGKSILARGGPNALSLLAMAEAGGFLKFPEIYFEKIAVGAGHPKSIVDLDYSTETNLKNLAESNGCCVNELVVCLLDRPRNAELITNIREVGARIRLILDGDVSGIIQVAKPDSGVDIYMGIGGAQEGVLAAAALRGMGGQMQGRLVVRNAEEESKAIELGFNDLNRKFVCEEMAYGNITFAATGVTYGPLLEGVHISNELAITHSLVVRSQTKTLRYIKGYHPLK